MIIGARIQERLIACGISQAELARRVKLSQSTINGLIKGEQTSTTKLHVIARELKTTPAYLSGETDAAEADLLGEMLSDEERESLEQLRQLRPEQREAVMRLIRTMTGRKRGATVHAPAAAHRPQEARK